MLAVILSHAPRGIEGEIVHVEADIRRGIPGIDVVGLPDGAVRESKERVRVAIRNSGLSFPADRILVNLAPAGMKKEGASFDLPIALAILLAAGTFPLSLGTSLMVLGELNLSGRVRPVRGVLSAVGSGIEAGIQYYLVPKENEAEARSLNKGIIRGISSLQEALKVLKDLRSGIDGTSQHCPPPGIPDERPESVYGDLSDLKAHMSLRRALEVAAAGRHNLFLFGPPGSGKTMAALRLPTLLPPLERKESLEVTRIHSVAGVLPPHSGLLRRRPFRMPHHTASNEGVIGGGKWAKPGEVSLAHGGVLFLDEAAEFRQSLLQCLREPVEQGLVTVVRVERSVKYPADFQLVLASNCCPCGNMGLEDKACICSPQEVRRYWKRMGGALLDRMDIRVPVQPVSIGEITAGKSESSAEVRLRVDEAVAAQRRRYRKEPFCWNGRIPAGRINAYCDLDASCSDVLREIVAKLTLSSRACHSILKMARTIADLQGSDRIQVDHVREAVQYRRFGEDSPFWNCG